MKFLSFATTLATTTFLAVQAAPLAERSCSGTGYLNIDFGEAEFLNVDTSERLYGPLSFYLMPKGCGDMHFMVTPYGDNVVGSMYTMSGGVPIGLPTFRIGPGTTAKVDSGHGVTVTHN